MDKYELIGQGVLKDSSLSEKAKTVISDYVCEWGGDAAVFVPSGRGNLLGISAPESFYVSTFYAFRKLKEGEVPEAFKLVGITDENLKGKASFDHNCPVGSIIIEKRREDQGSGEYILNVCGTKKKYSRTGTVYQEVKE